MTRKQIVPIKIYFSPSISFTIRTVVLWKIRESIWNFLLVNINIIFAIFDLLRQIWVQFWTFWLFFFQTGRFIEREAGMADFPPFVLFLAIFQLDFVSFLCSISCCLSTKFPCFFGAFIKSTFLLVSAFLEVILLIAMKKTRIYVLKDELMHSGHRWKHYNDIDVKLQFWKEIWEVLSSFYW